MKKTIGESRRFWIRRRDSGETFDGPQFVEAYREGKFLGERDLLLEVEYDYGLIRQNFGSGAIACKAPGIFYAWPLLPLEEPKDLISLGEGSTPLIPIQKGRALGPKIYFKNEAQNPTGSFKDRYDCLSVNVARRMGYRKVACASTGNHALAVAAYGAAAGILCLAIVSEKVSPQVLAMLRAYGAKTLVVPPADRFEELEKRAKEGYFAIGLHMPGPTSNPFGIEGYKTIAYELYREMEKPPKWVVLPCARGNGLYGVWKGFRELEMLGLTEESPRMVACQPKAAASLVKALESGSERPLAVIPGDSVADATCEAIASPLALEAIRASGGRAIALDDEEILDALMDLAKNGIFSEPSSAMAWAGARELIRRGEIQPHEEVVVVVTSTGLKTNPSALGRISDVAMEKKFSRD